MMGRISDLFMPPKRHTSPSKVYVSPALAEKMAKHPGAKVCVPCNGQGSLHGQAADWSGSGYPPSKCWSCGGEGFVVPMPRQEELLPGALVRIDTDGRPVHMEAALATTFQVLMDALSDSKEHLKLRAWAKDQLTRWGLRVTLTRSGEKGRIQEIIEDVDKAQPVCRCGHAKDQHIYHEGACRPGFICPDHCKEFTPT